MLPVYYQDTSKNYHLLPYYSYDEATNKIVSTPRILKIVQATATADDGNVPANVLDGNEDTRWSAEGSGQKLFLDLGGVQNPTGMKITWYRQDIRTSAFEILLDNAALSGRISSEMGKSTLLTFPDGSRAKQITIVGYGNSQNNWNSITTVEVSGYQLTEPVPPEPEPGPGPGPEPEPEPEPEPTPGLDHFGTKILFASKPNGLVFNAPFDTGSTRTLRSGQRDGNTDLCPLGSANYEIVPSAGEMRINGNVPRVYVFAKNRDHIYENVEMTCYYKLSSTSGMASYQGFELACRGQHELAGSNARVYYCRHTISGLYQRLKEDVHPKSNDVTEERNMPLNRGFYYGMKFVVQTVRSTGDVRLRAYQDLTDGKNGGDWKQIYDFTDRKNNSWAGWPVYTPETRNCACTSCFARSDNANDFRIKKFSIREISPL